MIEKTQYDKYRDAMDTAERIGTTLEKMLQEFFGSTCAWISEDSDYQTVRIRLQYPRGELEPVWSEYHEEDLHEFWDWMYQIDAGLPAKG